MTKNLVGKETTLLAESLGQNQDLGLPKAMRLSLKGITLRIGLSVPPQSSVLAVDNIKRPESKDTQLSLQSDSNSSSLFARQEPQEMRSCV